MAYTINKSDGSILTELIDNSIDQTSTSLTLIGKNVSNYGEFFNENLVRLLENFASISAPNFPSTGQLWFDTNENRLKVFDGSTFKAGSGPIVSDAQPTSFVQGDIWVDSRNGQVHFYDGVNLINVGPLFTTDQGISGFEVANVEDQSGNLKVITKLWVNETLIGVFSKETFIPGATIEGISGTVYKGFTSSTLAGSVWNLTASKANALVDPTGLLKTTNNFVSTEAVGGNTSMAATLTIQNSRPLILGPNQNNEVSISASSFQLLSNTSKQSYRIKVKNANVISEAISVVPDVSTTDWYVGVFNSTPTKTLDVTGSFKASGDATILGNLTVNGNVTTHWTTISGTYSSSSGDQIIVDTSTGPFTITLPSGPQVGDLIRFVDGSSTGFSTNNLTIGRNGNKINGTSFDLVVSTTGSAFGLLYTGVGRGWVYDKA